MTNTHTHDEYDNRRIHREVVKINLKRKAEEDLHIKPNKLIRRELQKTDNSEHLQYNDMKSIRRSIYEKRKKTFPNIPKSKSLEDAKKQLIDVQHNLIYKGNTFCFVSDDENIFIFIIRPTLTYGCEAWTTTVTTERRLRTFENRICRKICGPVFDANVGCCRRTFNRELQEIMNLAPVTSFIKGQRIQWLGHILRREENDPVRVAFE